MQKAVKACHTVLAVLLALAILLGSLLLPLACGASFVVWFNKRAETALALRQNQYERDSALALLNGQALAKYDQTDERLVLQLLIENIEQPFDTVALGSSRILQLTADTVGTSSFYNCGVSGADYRDIMTTFYRFEKAGMLPQNLIIGVDPWIFNGDETILHAKSDADLFEEFITLCLGYNTGWQAPAQPPQPTYWDYLDLDAFYENWDAVYDSSWQAEPPLVAQGDWYSQGYQLKLPDGSALYPARFRNVDQQAVDDRARIEAGTFLYMDGYQKPDAALCRLFSDFIAYVQGCGVNVVLFLAPYHPIVYDYATQHETLYTGFFLTEPWLENFALKNDIPIYGSYNPYVTGLWEKSFYDGLHIRGEAIRSYMPAMANIIQAQQLGIAKSPWLRTRSRITYPIAEKIIQRRYAVQTPHQLLQGKSEEINGLACYVVERYDPTQNNLLLARYAVEKETGKAWRHDNILHTWVVDPQF